MKIKKCMWCLKELETNSNEKYCSVECKSKAETAAESNVAKKGFFAVIGDLVGSLFS